MKIKIEATIDVSGELGELIIKELRHFVQAATFNGKYVDKTTAENFNIDATVGMPETVKDAADSWNSKKVKNALHKTEKELADKVRKVVLIPDKPKRGRPPKINGALHLKAGEHLCANKACKQAFRPTKFNQKYCSIKCEAHSLTSLHT